ncbi:MAG: glycosyltransferase family 61 protein [Rhodothermia bacterium]|nr:glycosyltransferase family 61 protein [Rhodothermia bacterium]
MTIINRLRTFAKSRRLHNEYRFAPVADIATVERTLERTVHDAIETPEMLDFPLWEEAEHLRNRTYAPPEDYVGVLRDVLYCPVNNVILGTRRRVAEETMDRKRLRATPDYDAEPVFIPGYSTLLRSPGKAYYHMLIDRLPRLIAVSNATKGLSETVNMLVPGGATSIEDYFVPQVVAKHMEFIDPGPGSIFRLEYCLFTPFKTRRMVGFIPPVYAQHLRQQLLPDRPSQRSGRVYISRETQDRRRISNRLELMEALEPLGFRSVIPERLKLDEEVELFYDAEFVIGPHGSGFTNVLFGDQLTMLELYPTHFMVPHFYYLCHSLGHRYDFMCQEGENRYPASYPVDVQAVLDRLAEHGIR